LTRTDQRLLLDLLTQMVLTDDLDVTRARLAPLEPNLVRPLMLTARAHGVEAWLSACLPSDAGPWRELAEQRLRFLAAQARSWTAVHSLGRRLDQHGIRWALLKGFAIAHTSYPRADLRYSVDMDVLVGPADFEAAVGLLSRRPADSSDGAYELLDVNWPLLARLVPGQQRLRAPNGTLLDLHWHLLNQPTVRSAFRFDTAALLAAAGRTAELDLPTLAPADQLLHTGVHAALAGGNRLCWLVDLDRLVRAHPVDWQQVARAARNSGGGAALAIALRRTQSVLGTPVPQDALSEFAGGNSALALQRVLDPRPKLTGDPLRPSFRRSLARSRRRGWWGSQLELARHGVGWLVAKGPGSPDPETWLDARHETSALHPVTDELALRAYYDAVKRAEPLTAGCIIGETDRHAGVLP
jgi:hypothetical protein